MVDAVVDAVAARSPVVRPLDAVPVRTRPRSALYVVVTPLLDRRGAGLIESLVRGGHDAVVLVVDTSPMPADAVDAMAVTLHRAAVATVSAMGAPVGVWRPDEPVDVAVRR